jgi:hypothetical protein
MCGLKHLRTLLVEALEEAKLVHKEDGQVWSAGRYDGLSRRYRSWTESCKSPGKTPRHGLLELLVSVGAAYLIYLGIRALQSRSRHVRR